MCLEVVFSLIHSSWYLVGPINLYIYIFLQYLGMLFYHLCSLYIFYILFFPRILSKWLQDFLDWSCMSYIYSLILFSVLLIYILRELLNFKFFLWKFYFSNHTSKRAEQSLSTAHFGAGKGRGIAQGCVVSAHSFIHSSPLLSISECLCCLNLSPVLMGTGGGIPHPMLPLSSYRWPLCLKLVAASHLVPQ